MKVSLRAGNSNVLGSMSPRTFKRHTRLVRERGTAGAATFTPSSACDGQKTDAPVIKR